MWQRPYPIVLLVGTALLLAAAQEFTPAAPLALIACVPWFCVARRLPPFKAAIAGSIVGFVYGCAWGAWIPDALIGLGASAPHALLGYVLAVAWSKLPLFALAGFSMSSLRRQPLILQLLGITAVFVLGEWLISSSSIGVPVALLGHSQLPLLGVAQVAVVAGVPAITGWLVATNFAITVAVSVSHQWTRPAVALVVGWAVLAIIGLPLAKQFREGVRQGAPVSLLVVQPDLPRGERWAAGMQLHNLDSVARYTDQAVKHLPKSVDAIVWPENLLTSRVDRAPELLAAIQRKVDRWKTPLITGAVRSASTGVAGDIRSSMLWIEPSSGIVDAIDKERAIPVIESSRHLVSNSVAASVLGHAANWPKVEEIESARGLVGSFEVIPTLCFEALFPGVVSKRRSPDSAAIITLADESWAGGHRLSKQLVRASSFRAIEQRLSWVRLAHGGLSVVVDPYGEQTVALPVDRYANVVATVATSDRPDVTERFAIAAIPLLASGAAYGALMLAGTARNARGRPENGSHVKCPAARSSTTNH